MTTGATPKLLDPVVEFGLQLGKLANKQSRDGVVTVLTVNGGKLDERWYNRSLTSRSQVSLTSFTIGCTLLVGLGFISSSWWLKTTQPLLNCPNVYRCEIVPGLNLPCRHPESSNLVTKCTISKQSRGRCVFLQQHWVNLVCCPRLLTIQVQPYRRQTTAIPQVYSRGGCGCYVHRRGHSLA